MIHFRDIPLGHASAELEGAYNPDLIVKGFLDPWSVLDKAKSGPEFLFLGYKGSGKSAIGEHLRLTATDDYSLFLLHHTRHTPRDFIQLLAHIQKCCIRGEITHRQILAGIRNYSSKYFLPEIRDELVGYVSQERSDALIRAISRLKRSRLRFGEISAHLHYEGLLQKADMLTLLESLFHCSAIGNVKRDGSDKIYWSYRFRNRHSQLNLEEEVVVHRGLWRAMNIR